MGGEKHTLTAPFFVLATQNPIEQEGTYPLPEAQQDRFMFKVFVDYPSDEEERRIVKQTTAGPARALQSVLGGEEIIRLQEIVRRVPAADHVIDYATGLVRSTRLNQPGTPAFVKEWVAWGAGPRASQFLILGAKARAVLQGRFHVSTDDIRAVAHPVLRHRIIANFAAEAEGMSSDRIIDKLIETVPAHPSETAARAAAM